MDAQTETRRALKVKPTPALGDVTKHHYRHYRKALSTRTTVTSRTIIVDDGDARDAGIANGGSGAGVLEKDVEVFVGLVLVVVDDRNPDALHVLRLLEHLSSPINTT